MKQVFFHNKIGMSLIGTLFEPENATGKRPAVVIRRGLRREDHGTHSLRRTKAAMIYKATGNLRAIQILRGHSKIENTVRYLGVDIEDALELAEHTEI